MHTVAIEIPERVAISLKIPPPTIQTQLKIELAVRLYQRRILSFGKARELAALTKIEFQAMLAQEQITMNYDLEELERDLDTLRTLPHEGRE